MTRWEAVRNASSLRAQRSNLGLRRWRDGDLRSPRRCATRDDGNQAERRPGFVLPAYAIPFCPMVSSLRAQRSNLRLRRRRDGDLRSPRRCATRDDGNQAERRPGFVLPAYTIPLALTVSSLRAQRSNLRLRRRRDGDLRSARRCATRDDGKQAERRPGSSCPPTRFHLPHGLVIASAAKQSPNRQAASFLYRTRCGRSASAPMRRLRSASYS
jgi:hypothetical protein